MPDSDDAFVQRASAPSPTSSAGSAKTANCNSRLAPMPSKLEPVSNAASTVKKRPSTRRYASKIRSPGNATADGTRPSGRISKTSERTARFTTGPARNTHVVVPLYTAPFCSNLIRS